MTDKKARTQHEYLEQWLLDNTVKARLIARDAIWLMYADWRKGKLTEDPSDWEFPSGSDYLEEMSGRMNEEGVIDVLRLIRLRNKRAKALPEVTHWIVSGRIPYDDEDSTFHVVVPKDSSPAHEFTMQMYEDSCQKLPRNYDDVENPNGAWIYINSEIEINGPPV
jgi:hypothetical protein